MWALDIRWETKKEKVDLLREPLNIIDYWNQIGSNRPQWILKIQIQLVWMICCLFDLSFSLFSMEVVIFVSILDQGCEIEIPIVIYFMNFLQCR